jgi:hypothetical protein
MIYPKGTSISAITQFDRSTKVAFECAKHPEHGTFYSKDPHVSRWFGEGQPCDDSLDEFVTASEYDDGGGKGNYGFFLPRPQPDGRERG